MTLRLQQLNLHPPIHPTPPLHLPLTSPPPSPPNTLLGEQLIVITNRERVGKLSTEEVWKMTGFQILPFVKGKMHLTEAQLEAENEYLAAVQRVLETENFYGSYKFDITRKMGDFYSGSVPLWQRVSCSGTTILPLIFPLKSQADPRFYFNRFLQRKMIDISQRDGEQNVSI